MSNTIYTAEIIPEYPNNYIGYRIPKIVVESNLQITVCHDNTIDEDGLIELIEPQPTKETGTQTNQ